jgi:hypothetical protein
MRFATLQSIRKESKRAQLIASAIEKRLGIYDLAEFTPKM